MIPDSAALTPSSRPASIVWTIGGSDASGAAGIQADLKTLHSFGVHGASIVTAVTAQGLSTFAEQAAISTAMVDAQMDALSHDLKPAVLKLGMLVNKEIVQRLVERLPKIMRQGNRNIPMVLDPVLRSSSGANLLDADAFVIFQRELIPLATIITPNIPEAERLVGFAIQSCSDMVRAANALLASGAQRVLLKGGHTGNTDFAQDYYAEETKHFWLTSTRHEGDCRGTGCAFASALAAALAWGEEPDDAVVVAKAYVTRGISLSASQAAVSQRLLQHASWPVSSTDWPWVSHSLKLAAQRPSFPSTSPTPLGFYPIVDRAEWIERLAPLGVTTFQLRIKDLQGAQLECEIANAVKLGNSLGVRVFINDFWEQAIAQGAYGVHLGQEDLLNADFEAMAKSGLRLGISTHSYYEVAVASTLRPSYIALGPIFPTTCKSMRFGPQSMERIAEWRRLISCPLVAIGGLHPEHVRTARAFGADGVAAISDVLHAKNPEARCRLWLDAWHAS